MTTMEMVLDSARIPSASAPHNKNKNSARNKPRAEACDDFSCGEYENDTDSSTYDDELSTASSDGSGDVSIH